MSNFKHKLGLVILMVFSSYIIADTQLENTQVVKLSSDIWCPYSCLNTGSFDGLLVDVVEAAFQEVNMPIQYDSFTSWTRAIQNVKNSTHDVLLGANINQGDDFEIAYDFYVIDETVFAAQKQNNVIINVGKDLDNYNIGSITEYEYDETGLWEPYIQNGKNSSKITSSHGEDHLLHLLVRDRIEVAVLNRDVANYSILNSDKYKNIQVIRKGVFSYLFIGFTKSERGKILKQKFIKGFKVLIGSNKLKNIYKKYNMEMPDFNTDLNTLFPNVEFPNVEINKN